MRVLQLLFVLVLAAIPGSALAMYCGSTIVGVGDSKPWVLEHCGQPTSINTVRVPRRLPGHRIIWVVFEEWLYNRGPNEFMRQLIIRGEVVTEERILGYGY